MLRTNCIPALTSKSFTMLAVVCHQKCVIQTFNIKN